jgi:RNA polymerase sigma factor (TIGR02999 family)
MDESSGSQVTGMESRLSSLIEAAESGDSYAAEPLFSALYSELHRIARRQLSRGGRLVTLSVTTLLHEAYLDMAARSNVQFPDEARFMGYAARVMRNLIINYARDRRAQKRGGLFVITSLENKSVEEPVDEQQLSDMGEALERLAKMDPELATVVDLKFFCGFSFAEIGAMRNQSERTVQRNWQKARIFLHQELSTDLSA